MPEAENLPQAADLSARRKDRGNGRPVSRRPWVVGAVFLSIALVVALVAGLVAGGLTLRDRLNPSLPPPIARDNLPAGRLLATLQGDVRIYNGLALQAHGSEFRAVDLRTGKAYWEHRRDGDEIKSWDWDDSGALFLLWKSGRIESANIRFRRLDWHRRIAGDVLIAVHDDSAPGEVIVASAGGLVRLDQADGQEKWRSGMAADCRLTSSGNEHPPLLFGQTIVVTERCGEADHLVAYTNGRRQWKLDATTLTGDRSSKIEMGQYQDGGGLLTVSDRHRGDGYALVDVEQGEVVKAFDRPAAVPNRLSGLDRLVKSRDWWVESEADHSADLISVEECGVSEPGGSSNLCAADLKTGEPLWRVRLPAGFRHSTGQFSLFRGKQLYLVLTRTGSTERRVAVFDAFSGTGLGQATVPQQPVAGGYRVVDVGDGVICVSVSSAAGAHVKVITE